ncbi:OsmC family protein [Microbacterium aureliae]
MEGQQAGMPAPQGPREYVVRGSTSRTGEAFVEAAGTRVALDARWGAPPTGDPGPADLLGSAFAACMLKNLARAGAMLGFSFDEATVEVVLHRQDAPPRFTRITYAMRIATDEPDRRVELVHANLRKFGTVFNTLAAVCEVEGSVTAERPV